MWLMAEDVQDLVSPLAGQLVGVVDDDGGLCGGKIVRYDRKQREAGPHLGFPNNPPLRITYRDTPPSDPWTTHLAVSSKHHNWIKFHHLILF